MNTIERTDKIDAYLAGTMSDAEKKEFEGLLSDPETSLEDRTNLQDEMELQKEIIHAIRRRGFREMVQEDIKEIQEEEHHRRIRRITFWSLGGVGTSAIAAVILLLFVVAPMARQMQDCSNMYIAQSMQSENYRGDAEFEPPLDHALQLMQADQWDEAETIINDVYQKPQDSSIDQQKSHVEAEWLKAICLMHDGKAIRAKLLLEKIAKSNSPYSGNAEAVLEYLKRDTE